MYIEGVQCERVSTLHEGKGEEALQRVTCILYQHFPLPLLVIQRWLPKAWRRQS